MPIDDRNDKTGIIEKKEKKTSKHSCGRTLRVMLIIILSLAVISAPFVAVITTAMAMPEQYGDLYHGILDEKVELLRSTEGEKIVVIGGSSVAFGVDADLLGRYTGMPVVNFGVYAALGTKMMLDLSRNHIGKGDIVVLALELDPQTLSLYFNSETALQAMEGDMSLLFELPMDDILSCLGGMWSFMSDKWQRYASGTPAVVDGVYSSRYFDRATGDFDYPREGISYTMLPEGYLTGENELVELRVDKLKNSEDGYDFAAFVDYLNDYISDVKRKGAEVVFSWCPMNSLAVNVGSDEVTRAAEVAEYVDYLKSRINCDFIGNINDHMMDSLYFFDSNYHLNDVGAQMNTMLLYDELRAVFDDFTIPIDRNDLPQPPPIPHRHRDADDDGICDGCGDEYDDGSDKPTADELTMASYLVLELTETDSGSYYAVVGLSDEGRKQTVISIPRSVDGIPVSSIREGAFDNADELRTLIIPENSFVDRLEGSVFRGASSLCDLWLYKQPGEINRPDDLSGVAYGFRIHVPEGSHYADDYFWSQLVGSDGKSFRDYVYDAN